jgi:hypothetical protein
MVNASGLRQPERLSEQLHTLRDWTTKDVDALVATGARFTSMTGYVAGNLTGPDGADTLLP